MTLVPPNPEYQFIQDTEPSNAKTSDWWLDTSANPPKSKVYDGSGFVEPQSISFVDQQVSSAGASISDIEQGAEDALEEDIANTSPASNSVYGVLDGGIAAVDWNSLTYDWIATKSQSTITVNGSGYVFFVFVSSQDTSVSIDGQSIDTDAIFNFGVNLQHRFDDKIEFDATSATNPRRVIITYGIY